MSTAQAEYAIAPVQPVFPLHARALPLETTFNKFLTFGIGLLLGVLTVKTEYIGAPMDLSSRIAPVDLLCIVLLVVLFCVHGMKMPLLRSLVYVAAIIISMVPGLLVTPGERSFVWTGAAALLMAFGYYLVGLNIGTSPALLRCMLSGLCLGVFGEGIIVLHDSVVAHGSQWFPDPMEGRVRGTFKTNGQLGAYSFCAAGMLFTFGATLGTKNFKKVCVVLGFVAAIFVFTASRRMGMFSMFAWAAMFSILAWRFSERRSYRLFVGAFTVVLVVIAGMWPQVEETFVGRRFVSAVVGMGKDDGFIQDQFRAVIESAPRWFPFGLGVGRGAQINPSTTYEVHNGVLAVLVELGVLGLIGFLAIVLFPLLSRAWHHRSREHQFLGVMITAFLVISVLMMFHNTLARDRAYLLYLGIATAIVMRESRFDLPSLYFPRTNPDNHT
jgi:hypothetical protein